MLRFNKEEKILYGFTHECAIPKIPERGISDDWESLKRYLYEEGEGGLKDDVKNIFLPALQEMLGDTAATLEIEDIKLEDASSESYFNDRDWKVRVKFKHISVNSADPSKCQYLTIMRIPYMHKDGIIEHDGKKFAFIKTLEQCPGLSWEEKNAVEKSVKLRLKRGYITVAFNASGPSLILSTIKYGANNTKFSLLRTIFTMALLEGYEPRKVWNEFQNPDLLEYYRNTSKLDKDVNLVFSSEGSINNSDYISEVVPRLTGTHFRENGKLSYSNLSCEGIRDELNEALSFKKVIGKKLARDVVSPLTGALIAKKGDTVTPDLVKACEGAAVYRLNVERKPAIENMFIAEPIFLTHIAKGVRVTRNLINLFKESAHAEMLSAEEDNMYISQDYYLSENPIIIWNGTLASPDIIELIMKSDETEYIYITDKANGDDDQSIKLYFMDEVLTNRQFPVSSLLASGLLTQEEVDEWDNKEWAYLDASDTLCPASDYFTTYDLAALASFTAKLFAGEYLNVITNSDEGFRKRIILPYEQYRNAFRSAVEHGLPTHKRALRNKWTNGTFFLADETESKFYQLTVNFWKYLRDDTKCVRLISSDAITNPLSYLAATTRIETFHKSKHSIADSQRRIAIGSFNRVDAYEIPQSASMGVVLNRTVGCNIDQDGTITVDYRAIKNINGVLTLTDQIDSLTVVQEEQYRIADIQTIKFDESGRITNPDDMVLARVPSTNTVEKQTFAWIKVSQVQYVNVNSLQPLSWTTAAMPFLSSNEAARIVFGAAQLKQAKGLIKAEKPRVMTSAYKIIPTLNDLYGVVAKKNGYIHSIRKVDIEKIRKADKTPYKNLVTVEVIYTDGEYNPMLDGTEETEVFSYKEFEDSHYSITVRKCNFRVGDRFKAGDTIISSNWVQDGILTLGVNALVGYRPDGYNYEDGVHESVALGQRLTSYKINQEFFPNRQLKKNTKGYCISKKRASRWISPEQNSVAFSVDVKLNNAPRPIRSNFRPSKAKGFLESADIVTEKSKGKVAYTGVNLSLCSVDAYGTSDKMANRHGNKGVAPISEPTSQMARLMNGVPLDISYNSAGVISRMNMGQVTECHAGLSAYVLDIYICTDSYNRISFEEVKMLLKYTHDLANSPIGSDPMEVCRNFPDIPMELHEHSCENIDKIRFWAGCFDEKGEAYLIDPKRGNRLTETKVLIGINYVVKLIQEGETKNHVRGGMMMDEPYTRLHGAPTHGSSEAGGQRSGTMELDAYCAYGCSKVIEEMINERGDNPIARNNLVANTYLSDDVKDAYIIEERGQRRSVSRFLYTLLALGIHAQPTDGEFYELSSRNSEQLKYYSAKALKEAGVGGENERIRKERNKTSAAKALSYEDSVASLDDIVVN